MAPPLQISQPYTSQMIQQEWESLMVWLGSRLRAMLAHLDNGPMRTLSEAEFKRYWKNIDAEVVSFYLHLWKKWL
jgi:hypothetical protein